LLGLWVVEAEREICNDGPHLSASLNPAALSKVQFGVSGNTTPEDLAADGTWFRGELIAKFGENRGAGISRKNYRASIGWSHLPT
jgi:hypothetical protein